MARALKGVSERPYLFTKCSLVWDEHAKDDNVLKKDSVKQECEDSLRRLQAEVIDLYQIHWPNSDEDIEEGREALSGLKDEGKVWHIVNLLEEIGDMHEKSLAEVSIAWTLRHPAMTAAIVGGRRPDHVDGIIGAAEWRLEENEVERIETFVQENP